MAKTPSSSATDWQADIYLNGLAGQRPLVSTQPQQLEEQARRKMSEQAFAYVAGGAGAERTMAANRAAFDHWHIVPQMLRNVAQRDTSIDLLGITLPSPLLLAPIGVLELAHREADLAVARAASQAGIPYIFSNQASVPMERVAAAMDETPRFFQLYWSKSNDLVLSFVQRAEACGCRGIVVTLDTTMLGWRTRDLDLGYLPFLHGKGIAQYTSDPVFQKLLDETPDDATTVKRKVTLDAVLGLIEMARHYPGSTWTALRSGRALRAVRQFVGMYSNPAVTWSDLQFLRKNTRLPILLKGILHRADARRALSMGVDGIIVSNHGGRQVDGSVATLDVLPPIVEDVNGQVPVLLDSGIRTGADVFKALALGANAVCLGRPYVYGLAIGGQRGVYEVLRHLMADFELTMGLAGCKNVAEISRDSLLQAPLT
ncbi:MAG: lactate 2-monooxygenase [Cytophagaceae bacterium]|nr:lactate 2-monooxygenase [Cytophagaceae bacterium]